MSTFGWSYPPGAANDPFAPYNMEDPEDNEALKDALADFESPYELYRAVYKGTSCGPSVGFCCYFDEGTDPDGYPAMVSRWYYCDSLRELGTWEDMDRKGMLVTTIAVSSIVEGVEATTQTRMVELRDLEPSDIAERFWQAVADTDTEAGELWDETHGCATCHAHHCETLILSGFAPDAFDDVIGEVAVWPDCPECNGCGTII